MTGPAWGIVSGTEKGFSRTTVRRVGQFVRLTEGRKALRIGHATALKQTCAEFTAFQGSRQRKASQVDLSNLPTRALYVGVLQVHCSV